MDLKQKLCKHKEYEILSCEKDKTYYPCKCIKCGYQFDLFKAKDEMYVVHSIIKLKYFDNQSIFCYKNL